MRKRWKSKPRATEAEIINYFWSQVHKTESGCWEWIGIVTVWGYGLLVANRKQLRAHVFSYQLHKGPTNGMCVCHSCDNRKCVNPAHLWLGTIGENIRDMYSKNRQNPQKGTERPNCKLTDDAVRTMREQFIPRHPTRSAAALARKFGVSAAVVWYAVHGYRWKHVK